MNTGPLSSAVAAPPLATVPAKAPGLTPPLSAAPPDIIAAWPRCAQIAAAFLLGAVASLLGVHAYGRYGGEPAELQEPQPITYRVDLNEARRAELLQLPGVGPNLAERIEDYRRAHGRFQSVDELRRVPGIGPATLEKLRPLVCVRTAEDMVAPQPLAPAPKQNRPTSSKVANLKGPVNINSASLTELQTLPGIGPKLSQRIVDEREKRAFKSVEDLRRVPGIGPKTLEKLKPYITVGPS